MRQRSVNAANLESALESTYRQPIRMLEIENFPRFQKSAESRRRVPAPAFIRLKRILTLTPNCSALKAIILRL